MTNMCVNLIDVVVLRPHTYKKKIEGFCMPVVKIIE